MAIRITEDGVVNYENSPDINRKLFPNLNICGKEIDELTEELDGKAPAIFSTASGSMASFDNGADDMPLKSCVVSFGPIQEGEGDPSPENVRPISGRTGLSVVRAGKNLLDLTGITLPNASTVTYVTVFVGDNIVTLSSNAPLNSGETTNLFLLPGNVSSGASSATNGVSNGEPRMVTAINGYVTVGIRNYMGVNALEYNNQLEVGSEATEYEPYKGSTYSVNWEAEAGTVYGGTLDVTSGKLTVNSALKFYNGSADEGWVWSASQGRAYVIIPDAKTVGSGRYPVICNRGYYLQGGVSVGCVFISLTAGTVRLYYYAPDTVTDLDSLLIWLSENNLQIVYELAETIEYQLTPQEINTLLGTNNIWVDSGNILEVKYTADTKTYIDDLSIKTVEVTGQTQTITAEENTRYICGEVTSLSFTPCEKGICDVRFTAASISTVLTLPETVKLPEWFDPTLLEAGTTYEINVLDGIYGVVMAWA